jgi:hypothetical protein
MPLPAFSVHYSRVGRLPVDCLVTVARPHCGDRRFECRDPRRQCLVLRARPSRHLARHLELLARDQSQRSMKPRSWDSISLRTPDSAPSAPLAARAMSSKSRLSVCMITSSAHYRRPRRAIPAGAHPLRIRGTAKMISLPRAAR